MWRARSQTSSSSTIVRESSRRGAERRSRTARERDAGPALEHVGHADGAARGSIAGSTWNDRGHRAPAKGGGRSRLTRRRAAAGRRRGPLGRVALSSAQTCRSALPKTRCGVTCIDCGVSDGRWHRRRAERSPVGEEAPSVMRLLVHEIYIACLNGRIEPTHPAYVAPHVAHRELVEHTGHDFGYDVEAWNQWFLAQGNLTRFNESRRSTTRRDRLCKEDDSG